MFFINNYFLFCWVSLAFFNFKPSFIISSLTTVHNIKNIINSLIPNSFIVKQHVVSLNFINHHFIYFFNYPDFQKVLLIFYFHLLYSGAIALCHKMVRPINSKNFFFIIIFSN
jgi:hypothetical protein